MSLYIRGCPVLLFGLSVVLVMSTASCMVPGLNSSAAGRLAALPEADSLRILEAAKADQKAFEVFRRSRMQMYGVPTLYPECGSIVGRYCMDLPIAGFARLSLLPENPDVIEARRVLADGLSVAAARIPGDRWIQGQRVRYLVEAGEFEGAINVARECEVIPAWWCMALLGYALHHAGRPVEAEAAFRATLVAMEPGERDVWLSPLLVLEEDDRIRFLDLDSAEQAEAGAAFWLLADPLWTREGNEIFAEHLSRWVATDLQMGAEPTEGSPWGVDLIEIMVRYGSAGDWVRGMGAYARETRVRSITAGFDRWSYLNGESEPLASAFTAESAILPLVGSEASSQVMEIPEPEFGNPDSLDPEKVWAPPRGIRDIAVRHSFPARRLLPPSAVLFAGESQMGSWESENSFPMAGYDLPMGGRRAEWLGELAKQRAVFPRGDSAIVVMTFDLPANGIDSATTVNAGVAILPLDAGEGSLRVLRQDGAETTGAFAFATPAVPSIVSLELVLPEEGRLARDRVGIDLSPTPISVPRFSDLLLLEAGSLPTVLPAAIEVVRPSNRVPPGEEVAIFWELHGLDLLDIDEVSMSLTLHPPPRVGLSGVLRGLAGAVGLVGNDEPIRTEWIEEVSPGAFMGRSLEFRFPEGREGVHIVEVRANLPGREPLVALQEVVVTRETLPPTRPVTLIRRPTLTRVARPCPPPGHYNLRCFLGGADDPSIFGHYGGERHLSTFGYDGW